MKYKYVKMSDIIEIEEFELTDEKPNGFIRLDVFMDNNTLMGRLTTEERKKLREAFKEWRTQNFKC